MKRMLGSTKVHPIGLGCMSLSHAYGVPPERSDAIRLLNQALDLGYDHLDTAALYGFGANEALVGEAIGHRRNEYFLASKCGMTGVDGKRVIDGRPETLRRTIDESLARLNTDRIDLYYLHRLDRSVAVEDSVGELARMVETGKIGGIGLSEVSAATLRRAHAVHPVTAVQNEYSLWSRNVELGVLDTTRELGVTLVAFSPLARGFLAGSVTTAESLVAGDIRRGMPRFQPGNIERNGALAARVAVLATDAGMTAAQLCLAWLLSRGDHVLPIPGTTSSAHLAENIAVRAPALPAETLDELERVFARGNVAGARYPAATQAEIDTEEYPG